MQTLWFTCNSWPLHTIQQLHNISTPCPFGACTTILYSLLSCSCTTCLIILLSAFLVWVIRKVSLPPTSPDVKFYTPFKAQRSWLAYLYLPSSQLHHHTCSGPAIWCRSQSKMEDNQLWQMHEFYTRVGSVVSTTEKRSYSLFSSS